MRAAICNKSIAIFKLAWRREEVLVEKPEGQRPLGRPRRIWKDNIKMDLQGVGCGHGLVRDGSG